jgi:hypothetical protein
MLNVVDHSIFLKGKEELLPDVATQVRNLTLMEGTGPQAWNDAILDLLHHPKIESIKKER